MNDENKPGDLPICSNASVPTEDRRCYSASMCLFFMENKCFFMVHHNSLLHKVVFLCTKKEGGSQQ